MNHRPEATPLAARPRFSEALAELWRYRGLLRLWALREIRARYKQSVLGAAWALLQPLALAAMFSLVFARLLPLPADGPPYPLFSYSAVLVWTFFSTGISAAASSLTTHMNLVSKVYFPREVLPLAAVAAAGVDFLVASSGLVLLFLWYGWPLHWTAVWALPILAVLLLLMAGLGLLAAATIVYIRDLRFVVPLGLQLWFYASPVLYPVELVPERLRPWYALNPMVGLLGGLRDALLLGKSPDPRLLGPALVLALLGALLGYAIFKRLEQGFADVI